MPHVTVKFRLGKSERQKARLAGVIAGGVTDVLGDGEESVSVAIQEVEPRDWAERVYEPDTMNKRSICSRSRATTCLNCQDRESTQRTDTPVCLTRHRTR